MILCLHMRVARLGDDGVCVYVWVCLCKGMGSEKGWKAQATFQTNLGPVPVPVDFDILVTERQSFWRKGEQKGGSYVLVER